MSKGVGVNDFLYGGNLFTVRKPLEERQLRFDQLNKLVVFGTFELSK